MIKVLQTTQKPQRTVVQILRRMVWLPTFIAMAFFSSHAWAQGKCGAQGFWDGVHSEIAFSNQLLPVFGNYFLNTDVAWKKLKPERPVHIMFGKQVGIPVCNNDANKVRGAVITAEYVKVVSAQERSEANQINKECSAKERELTALSPEKQALLDEKRAQTRQILGNKGAMASLTPEERQARTDLSVFQNRINEEHLKTVQKDLDALRQDCRARTDPLTADARYTINIQVNAVGRVKADGNDFRLIADIGDKSIQSGPNDRARRFTVYVTPTSQGAQFNAERVAADVNQLKSQIDLTAMQALLDAGGALQVAAVEPPQQVATGTATASNVNTNQPPNNARKNDAESMPRGEYVLTRNAKSNLAPGERFGYDPSALPTRDSRWAANYDDFTPPAATTAYGNGPRSVVMTYTNAHTNYKSAAVKFKRLLSNPYIPTEKVDLPNPNWLISPFYSQGFFYRIEAFSCRADGSLFVQGKVGVPATSLNGRHWARGIWKVEPDGKILPYEVYPDQINSYMRGGILSCAPRTCELPSNAPRERAIEAGSHDWVQDKHGNVWGISGRGKGKQCFVKRFNVDGTETEILDHKALCEVPQGYTDDFTTKPIAIVYDEARDEVVFSGGEPGGNTAGSHALFRVNQAGQAKELLRNWMTRTEASYGPNPPGKRRADSNQVKEGWWDISGLVYNPKARAVWFEVSVFSENGYPGRTYEIKDTFATLKRLPYSTAGQISWADRGADKNSQLDGDDQRQQADVEGGNNISAVFGQNCFDDAGNRYFKNGVAIRKMDPQGRLSTWVR